VVQKLKSKDMRQRYQCSNSTLDRWSHEDLIPKPMRIRRTKYWDLNEVEAYDKARSNTSGAAIKHPTTE
jgi:predicted DNA-binding transcriptional regulator AlpA